MTFHVRLERQVHNYKYEHKITHEHSRAHNKTQTHTHTHKHIIAKARTHTHKFNINDLECDVKIHKNTRLHCKQEARNLASYLNEAFSKPVAG